MNEKEIILNIFWELSDPRQERIKVHGLEILMFIAFSTYVTVEQSFCDMELLRKHAKDGLKKMRCYLKVRQYDKKN